MRGGTSKGLYFLKDNLPDDTNVRDQLLIAAMGSPDARQIDGLGGGHPLTSKVAIVSKSSDVDADVDYLFLQVAVERGQVSDSQNCGNILAGVGPFAIEQGLVTAEDGATDVRIRMQNTGGIAVATVQTPQRTVDFAGSSSIDGVKGTAAPIMINFVDVSGSSCGALLPTGNPRDTIDGVIVTCIDNGMPVVVVAASEFGKVGYESPEELESDGELKARVESIRRQASERMNLGIAVGNTVPKVCLIAPARGNGVICTRTFIPHRVHQAIGVLGAVSVATSCCIPGSVAYTLAGMPAGGRLAVEHPSGQFEVDIEITQDGSEFRVDRSAVLRTARKLMDGQVYVPESTG